MHAEEKENETAEREDFIIEHWRVAQSNEN